MSTGISIIIATHNRAELLDQTLESLRACEGVTASDEVVVVANACTDSTLQVARRHAENHPIPVRVIDEPIPGLGVARNRGAREARGTMLAYIDDDVILAASWLEGVRAAFRDHGADLVTGPVELSWDLVDEPDWLSDRGSKLLTRLHLGEEVFQTTDPNHFVGANMSLSAELWRRLDGFRDALGRRGQSLLSGEDTEFIQRALERGAVGIYHPHASLRHVVTPERATPGYLEKAAAGRGLTRVVMSRMGADHRPFELLRIGIAQWLLGTWWALSAGRDRTRRVDGAIVSARGRGTVAALLRPGRTA